MSASITFDQLEGRADRTLGFVLWAKHVKNVTASAVMMAVINGFLHSLVSSLSAEHLDALRPEQVVDLTKKLQEVHAQLSQVLTYGPVQELAKSALFRGSIEGLEESNEDLFDIIENLVLSENKQFQRMLSECVADVDSHRRAGSVGEM